LVAANRDERFDRPAAPPEVRGVGSSGSVLCPTDLEAGGTWWGLSARGLFAAVTNRFGVPTDRSRRSRGLLVLDALTEATASSGASRVAAWPASTHNGFHLVVASAGDAHLVHSDGLAMRCEVLDAGIHVITERSLGAGTAEREIVVRKWFEDFASGPPPGDDALAGLLARHGDDPLSSVCVHLDERRYGTRSSTIFRLGEDGRPLRLLHANGPPCRTPYADLGASLAELAGTTTS
jgi:uncharacterized protein with NRDE domain